MAGFPTARQIVAFRDRFTFDHRAPRDRKDEGPFSLEQQSGDKMISTIVPAGLCTAEFRETSSSADLLPQEKPYIRRATAKRISDFAGGRRCAREALKCLGIEEFPILVNEDRTPRWPPATVGSITHTKGYCAAAIGRADAFHGIGIDAERTDGIEPRLWPEICTSYEVEWLRSHAEEERRRLVAILFSAKEAFYKCQYPITSQVLGFHDVNITLDDGRFSVEPDRSIDLEIGLYSGVQGRFLWLDGLVVTSFILNR
jgi:enterobactin synthetase component D